MASPDPQTEFTIISVLKRERYYRDTCQWAKLRSAYHPDASKTSINITWYLSCLQQGLQLQKDNNVFRFSGNIDGFVKGSETMAASGVSALHTISPVEIVLNASGDKALSESTGSITIRFAENGTEYDLTSVSRFVSRLVKVDQVWRMLSLACIYVRESIVPAFPTATACALDLGSRGPTRKSYRYLGALLMTLGHNIPEDLPGTDDDASVKAVTDANAAWLREG